MNNNLENDWHNGILEIVSAVKEAGFVIYGVGEYGELTYDIFRLWNLTPLCFADDSDIYHTNGAAFKTDIPIRSLDEAVNTYPNAVFIRADSNQYSSIQGLGDIVNSKTEKLIKLGVCGRYTRFQPLRYKFLVLYASEMGIESFNDIEGILECVYVRQNQFDRYKMNAVIFQSFVNVSGSLMFAQLCDGHPQFLSLPLILETTDRLEIGLASAFLYRLRNLSGLSLAIEIMAQIPFLIKGCEKIDWFLDIDGNEITENIQLSSVSLFNALYAQVRPNKKLSFGDIFKAIHCAYANASGKIYNSEVKYYIFYHLHAWGFRGLYWRDFFEKVYYLNTIREPLRSSLSLIRMIISNCRNGDVYEKNSVNNAVLYAGCYWLNKHSDGSYHYLQLCSFDNCEKGYIDMPTCLLIESTLEEKIDYLSHAILDSMGDSTIYFLKFEDLKLSLNKTMHSLCKLLDIEFDPILLETTANGIKIYESTNYISNDLRTRAIDQKDMISMQSVDYKKYMSEYDMERIKIIFKEIANYFFYGEYSVKSISDLTNDEKMQLFDTPYKLQIDCDLKNESLTRFINAYNMASAVVVKNVVKRLREQNKNYLIKP